MNDLNRLHYTILGDPANAAAVASAIGVGTEDSPTFTGLALTASQYIGDTANVNMTLGLTINQGSADNEILALKSSDIAHGITGRTETDTFGYFQKVAADTGGLSIVGLGENVYGLHGTGNVTVVDTSKATSSVAAVMFLAGLKSGTGIASMGAGANILTLSDNGTVRFIFDADGGSHQDVGTAWTNFDSEDDIALLNATSALLGPDTLRRSFTEDFLVANRQRLSDLGVVTFNEDGHHFINWSRFNMLHMGGTRYNADKIQELTQKFKALDRKMRRLEAR
jgi:hypothetical protein